MAKNFSPYSMLPLAWFDFSDNAYCIRLEHQHSLRSTPSGRRVVIEIKGHKGYPALLVAKTAQERADWKVNSINTADADALVDLVDKKHVFAMTSVDRPRGLGAFYFALEIRRGRDYAFIKRDVLTADSEARDLGGFISVVRRLFEFAGVPESEIFFGPTKPE
jgi:hypothetical protein